MSSTAICVKPLNYLIPKWTFYRLNNLVLLLFQISYIIFCLSCYFLTWWACVYNFRLLNFKSDFMLKELLIFLKYFQTKTVEFNSFSQCLFHFYCCTFYILVLLNHSSLNFSHFLFVKLDCVQFFIWGRSGDFLKNLQNSLVSCL